MSTSISLIFDQEERSRPALEQYVARRLEEHLLALSGVRVGTTWRIPQIHAPRRSGAARSWHAFEQRLASVPKIPERASMNVSSIEEIPERPDFFFVHSSRADTLVKAAERSTFGAFELRHSGSPLAAITDFAWPEVASGAPIVGVDLCWMPKGGAEALSFGPWQVRTSRGSPARTAFELIESCSWLLELAMRAFAGKPAHLAPAPAQGLPGREPSPRLALRLWWRFALCKAQARFRAATIRASQWGIGYLDPVEPEAFAGAALRARWLAPGPDEFWADPFLVEEGGRTFLLFEELSYNDWRGHLCAAEIPPGRQEGSIVPRKVLSKSFHLSFPFCFRHDGQMYLLPEQAESGKVQAYRAREFPFEWEDGPVLLPDFPGIDNVLFEHEGRWWLFTTSGRAGNHDNHLMLFHSSQPFGPFEAHPMNPIRMGLEGSRMGGAILRSGGRLLRPAQNCSNSYGGSLQFYEIEVLSTSDYRERNVTEVFPDPASGFPKALHSWSHAGSLLAIDGMRDLKRW